MARFAAHTIIGLECLNARLGWRSQRMTCQTLGSLGRRTRSAIGACGMKDLPHAFRHVIGEHLVGARVLVVRYPGAVFVLLNPGERFRLYAAMAGAGGTTARADVLASHRICGISISGAWSTGPGMAQMANKVSDPSQHTLQRIVIVRSVRHNVALLPNFGVVGLYDETVQKSILVLCLEGAYLLGVQSQFLT